MINFTNVLRKTLPFFTLLLFSLGGMAQEQYFPVVAKFTQRPPYPIYLADFSNPSQTNLSIQIRQNDRTIASRPFRIRIYIEGQGFRIESIDKVLDEPSLVLNFGQVYDLPSVQVANYFKQYNLKVTPEQYRQPFNEGTFRFGVEIVDFATDRPISGIQWSTPVWITVNEPPVWAQPKNEELVKPTMPQNLIFQWLPRHNNISNVEYEFEMTEIISRDGNVGMLQSIFLSQPTFYKVRTQSTTLNYNATLPPLVAGRIYAYRVRALAKRGNEDVGIFRNNGFSEIHYLRYGETILPPTNLKVAWADNNKDATLNWRGEPNHKSFEVEAREKDAKNAEWSKKEVPTQGTGLYNNFTFNNLDPSKNYEVRVTGIGPDGQKATSSVVELKLAPAPPKQEELVLKGKIQWTYFKGEENLSVVGKVIGENMFKDLPKRELKHASLGSKEASSQRFGLENAIVVLLGADEELTMDTYKSKNPKRIESVYSDANGDYTFKGKNVKLLNETKFLYVLAEYQGTVFAPTLTKIDVRATDTGTKELGGMTLFANSIRFEPKIVIDKKNLITGQNIDELVEEIGLYRLKSVIDKFSFLKNEGSNPAPQSTVSYNNDTYVKVADFTKTTTASQLFYNKPFNDKFVLRIKLKDRKHVIFPINDIESFQENNYAHVIDYFNFVPPAITISGYVERKGTTNERVKNASVNLSSSSTSLAQKPVKTDKDGYFEFDLPNTLAKGTVLKIEAVDPFNTNNTSTEEITYQGKEETKNLLLKGVSFYVEGRVIDRSGSGISGAIVKWDNQNRKADQEGYFSFASVGDEVKGAFQISFDGYRDKSVKASVFKRVALKGNTEKELIGALFDGSKINRTEKVKEDYYANNFGNSPNKLSNKFVNYDSLVLDNETTYRLLVYTNNIRGSGLRDMRDSSTVTSALLEVEGKETNVSKATFIKKENDKEIWTGGYVNKTFESKLVVKVANKKVAGTDTTYTPEFLEEEVELPLPKKLNRKDTVVLKVRLKPAVYFYGTVYDSTTFIKGVHADDDKSVRRPGDPFTPLDSVEVSVSGSKGKTNKEGLFRVLVPKGEEFELEVSRSRYASSKYAIKPAIAQQHDAPTKKRKDTYLIRTEKVPEFKTLMGFDIKVDRAVKQSATTFKISGTLQLNTGKLAPNPKNTNMFDAGKTTSLTFKDIIVKQDTNKTNAITMASSINFVETEAEILLFKYAPITLEGNPIGEPYIRLVHLDTKGRTASSEGKIGGSVMVFTQKKMMGVDFGKMELKLKEPEKEKKFGKANDKISDKEAATREEKYKADKAEIAKNKPQEEVKAIPEKEPLMLAFAPLNLDELADNKEFLIEFPQAATKGETKKLFAKKDTTGKEDPYKDYISFGLGPLPIIGRGIPFTMPKIGIDPTTAVLKKSGVSMKGVFFFPQLWQFLVDKNKPPTIEKLEIDRKFEMKTISIGKSNPDKKEIIAFGVASSWMCFINTIQIYHSFRGFGAGGTFNTDKNNYININSFGLSVIDKQVYPNVDLSTPKEGFRFSKLRFKTVGSKSISIKGNPDDKSYEVEGSLRIEWDESELTSSATDTTDKFGKRLSDADIANNRMGAQNKANDAEQAELKAKREARLKEDQALADEKAKFLTDITKQREALQVEEDALYKQEENVRLKRIALTRKGKGATKEEEDAQVKSETETKARRTALDARWSKWDDAKNAKEAEFEKTVAENKKKVQEETDKKAAADKAVADKKDEAARTAVESGKQRQDVATKDKEGPTWKERLFPIEVQLFKWSTTGKFMISASLSQDALKIGPLAVKVRRIIYARGEKIKKKEIDDLLKLSEDEVAKLNSTAKFNNANTYIDNDGKRIGATSEENQRSKEGATTEGFNVKAIEDKVAVANPDIVGWALGFAGGIEVETKSINVDSDASFYIADFDGKGHVFTMNEIMLKIDATSFRAMAKMKLSTSGKKIGFEGEGEFEGAKIKTAIALKYYKLYDDFGKAKGEEFGGAFKVSMGPKGFPMGPITWTAMGGGFERNTADQKFAIFFLGDAYSTGVAEKVVSYKKIKISLEFEGKTCGSAPVLKGFMELWSGVADPLSPMDKKVCNVSVDLDFCRTLVVAKMDCEMQFVDKMVKVDALAFAGKSTGLFIGAKVRAELFGMNANGLFILGISCDTQDGATPKELGAYTSVLPAMYYQNDNRTISALYLGIDLSYEVKKNGGASAFGVKLISYSAEALLKGKLSAGVNFSNGNFAIAAAVKLEAEANAKVLGFPLFGKLNLDLLLGGGRNNEVGWNFQALAAAKLEIGAGAYEGKSCNDFSITGIKWCKKETFLGDISYPCGTIPTFLKLCLEGQIGVLYQEKGPKEVQGWRFQTGGTAPTPPKNTTLAANNQQLSGAITVGNGIKAGESITSENKTYKFTVQTDGNMVIYKNDMPIWSSGTYGKNIDQLKLLSNGNLVAYDKSASSVWESNTSRSERNDRALVLQNDGNLVLYEGQNALWATGTSYVFAEAEIASTSILRAEEMLRVGETRSSQNGQYTLLLQKDGNVVLYKDYKGQKDGKSQGNALWATGTNGRDVDAFKMQKDGNLVAYLKGGRATWSSATNGKGGGSSTVLLVQNDGNVIMYKRLESTTPGNIKLYRGVDPIWATQTAGR